MDQIQPVTAPSLAIMRRLQQAVHQGLPCVLRVVVEERLGFFGCGGQPDQIQVHAPNQGPLAGRAIFLESLLLQLPVQERVDRVAVAGPRNGGTLWRDKCPPSAFLVSDRTLLQFAERLQALGLLARHRGFRHGCAGENPFPQDLDLLLGKLACRGHERLDLVVDELPEPASAEARCRHGGATFAAQQNLLPGAQVKAGLLDGSPVAHLAVLLEYGVGLLRKIGCTGQ